MVLVKIKTFDVFIFIKTILRSHFDFAHKFSFSPKIVGKNEKLKKVVLN